MAKDHAPGRQLVRRPIWFTVLLLLDAFALGGLVAMKLALQVLESTMDRLIKVEAQAEILNVLDHLFPYWLGYIGVSLLLVLITAGAYVRLRAGSNME